LSESFSLQSQILNTSKLGLSTSNHFMSPQVHTSAINPVTTVSHSKSTPTKASSYQYQIPEGEVSVLRDSFASVPEQKGESHALNGSMHSSVEDEDLTSLIKHVMRQKLSHLFVSSEGSVSNGKSS